MAEHLARHRVNVWNGDNYAWELAGVLGIRSSGSAVRAGLVHYNDRSDVDRLLTAVAELALTRPGRAAAAPAGQESAGPSSGYRYIRVSRMSKPSFS